MSKKTKSAALSAPEIGALYRTRPNTGINLQLKCESVDDAQDDVYVTLSGMFFSWHGNVEQFEHFFEKTIAE